MDFFKKLGRELGKKRTIDISVEKTLKSVKSGYKIVPSLEIKAPKAYLIITFMAGFSAALIWSAYMSVYPVSRAEDTQQVTLSASAVAASHKTGDEFPVQILLDTAGKAIVAVQAVFNYDKNAVQVISVDTSGSDFNYEIKNSIDTESGQGFLALAKPTPGVSGAAIKVATVNLKALADVTEPVLQLKFDSLGAIADSAAILDDGNGTNVLQKVMNKLSTIVGNNNGFTIESLVALTDTLVKVGWTEGISANANYLIERKTGKDDFSKMAETGSDARSFIDRSAKPSKLYAYRICQLNGTGEKTCTPGKQVKTPKKKKIFKPRLSAVLQDGKVNLSWIPTYTVDFRLVLQKKIGKAKKFTTLSTISSDSQSSYLDENVASGQQITYHLIVSAKKKTSQTARDIKIKIP